MKLKHSDWLIVTNIMWAGIIFTLCAMPGKDIPDPGVDIPHLDKVVHFGLFFVMSLLIRNTFEYEAKCSIRLIRLFCILFAFAYGGILELLQHYFFNRTGDWLDLLADAAGGMAGCLFYPELKQLRRKVFKKDKG